MLQRRGSKRSHASQGKQQSGDDVALRAIEKERVKQYLRQVSGKFGLTYAQARALYNHWNKDIEPVKTKAALERQCQAPKPEEHNPKVEERREQLLSEFDHVSTRFAENYFPQGHSFPYDGKASVLDQDADQLTFEDYLGALEYLAKKGRVQDRLLFLFQLVDRDADGAITLREFMEILSPHSTLRDFNNDTALYGWIKKNFKLADVDRSGTLDFYECIGILEKHPTVYHQIGFNIDAVIDSIKAKDK